MDKNAERFVHEIFHENGNWSDNLLFPRTVPLHVMMSNCGWETRRNEPYYFDGLDRGNSEFAIFQYTIAGEGVLEYENRKIYMHEGDAMLLHVPHPHKYYLEKDSCWRLLYLTVSGIDMIRLMREAEKNYGPVIHLPQKSLPIVNTLNILQQTYDRKIRSVFHLSALLYEFIMSLHEFLSAGYPGHESQDAQLVSSVHQYCLEHLTEELDVTQIAKEFGYSRAHFSRIFKEISGSSPAHYFLELRMRTALRILQMEKCSVKELGYRCGFSDESYFCKVFKQYFGMPPEHFRQQSQNGRK